MVSGGKSGFYDFIWKVINIEMNEKLISQKNMQRKGGRGKLSPKKEVWKVKEGTSWRNKKRVHYL